MKDIIFTISLCIVVLLLCILIGGCETKKPVLTDIDSPIPAPNICLQPENKDTAICKK